MTEKIYKPYITVKEQVIETSEIKPCDCFDVSLYTTIPSNRNIQISNMKVVVISNTSIYTVVTMIKENVVIMCTFFNNDGSVKEISVHGKEINYFYDICIRLPNTDTDWISLDGNLTYPKTKLKKIQRPLRPGDILDRNNHKKLIVEYITNDGSIVAYRQVSPSFSNDLSQCRSILIRNDDTAIMESITTKLGWS